MTRAEVCRQVETETGRRLSERTLREWLRRDAANSPTLENRLARIEESLRVLASQLQGRLPEQTEDAWQPPAAQQQASTSDSQQPLAAGPNASAPNDRQPLAADAKLSRRLPAAANSAQGGADQCLAHSGASGAAVDPSVPPNGPQPKSGTRPRRPFFDEL